MAGTAHASGIFQLWVDAQLPPSLSHWLRKTHGADVLHVKDLGLERERDSVIRNKARASKFPVVILTKDDDFARLVGQFGSPPQIVWLRCGNVRNHELRRIVLEAWPRAVELLAAGEPLVEIRQRLDAGSR